MPDSSCVSVPCVITGYENIFMGEMVSIGPGSVLFAPNRTITIKSYSFSGPRLYIGTGNHMLKVGFFTRAIDDNMKRQLGGTDLDWDVLIEEDVWMGENVSILCKKVGRGCVIAAGSVVTKDVPPYAVVGGVPARFLKFHFTIDEIIEHESKLYKAEERLSKEYLIELFDNYKG